MDLVYKIYSVYLYDNQLEHGWVFFYNRKWNYRGELVCDAPYHMFSRYDWCASQQIYNMDKVDPNFKEKSVYLMMEAAKREGVNMIRSKDFLTLQKINTTHMSNYNAYDVIWNETLSGFNPHQFEVMGVWVEGSSQYSSYRIWEEVSEREKAIRDNKLIMLGV